MPRLRNAAHQHTRTNIDGQGFRIGIVAARFNEAITARLYDGALNALQRCGVADKDVTTVWVPGALELPWAALHMSKLNPNIDALIALGCVIRGETYHFEVVADGAVHGIQEVSLAADMPIAFGVLTTYDEAQAWARSGGALGNHGADAAETAVYMAHLRRQAPRPLDVGNFVGAQSTLDRGSDD